MNGNGAELPRPKGHPNGSDDLPPCLIHVDLEGRMWHLGAEMTHEGINNLLRDNVSLDEYGNYIVSLGGRRCFAEVEDTFFTIARVDGEYAPDGGLVSVILTLNDGTTEKLDPTSLHQNRENVMYARVKDGRFPARFLRRGYYQLTEFVLENGDHCVLPLGGCEYILG
jgi:hypothetical protein